MIHLTPRGLPIWNGMAVDTNDLPMLRKCADDWRLCGERDEEIKRSVAHTDEVVRALENYIT